MTSAAERQRRWHRQCLLQITTAGTTGMSNPHNPCG